MTVCTQLSSSKSAQNQSQTITTNKKISIEDLQEHLGSDTLSLHYIIRHNGVLVILLYVIRL